MEEIRTVIGIRHDKSDDTRYIFTTSTIADFEKAYATEMKDKALFYVQVAVDGYENLYTPQKLYGSDSYLIEKKPAAFRGFMFPISDLVMIQEVHYKFKDGD